MKERFRMLVLSRKVGQEIYINDRIVVRVTRISGNRVSLGIEAPSECRIVRAELEPDGSLHILPDDANGKPKDDSHSQQPPEHGRKRTGESYRTHPRRLSGRRRDAS